MTERVGQVLVSIPTHCVREYGIAYHPDPNSGVVIGLVEHASGTRAFRTSDRRARHPRRAEPPKLRARDNSTDETTIFSHDNAGRAIPRNVEKYPDLWIDKGTTIDTPRKDI